MPMKRFFTTTLLIFLSFNVFAQFYHVGDDKGSLKWNSIESQGYQVIYPEGLDSLAYNYTQNLEKYRFAVGRSLGMYPGQHIKKTMPVLLHPSSPFSNGSVAWAPKRIDLFTTPQAYDPDPLPWTEMLAIHESRHAAQMQFGLRYAMRPFGWFFGEAFNGLAAGLYPTSEYLEGDAVVAETALSRAGRGRNGEFLNYYMIAFDKGDWRRWSRWLYGSQKHYTPDHYALGYLFVSGMRTRFNTPDYMDKYFTFVSKKPYNLNNKGRLTQNITGKNFDKTFEDIMRYHNDIWQQEMKERGPFMPMTSILEDNNCYTQYRGTVLVDNELYSIKESFNLPTMLVSIDAKGIEHDICPFANTKSKLSWSPYDNRIYWSENLPDPRWSLAGASAIRYIVKGKEFKHTLSSEGKMYHPCANPTTGEVVVSEYLNDARTQIVTLSPIDGHRLAIYQMPDSLQVVEPLWHKGEIYFTAISEQGTGIYKIEDGKPSVILAPQPVTVKNLRDNNRGIYFTSDLGGVNELYMLNADNQLYLVSNTKYGSNDHVLTDNSLIFSANLYEGKLLNRTDSSNLKYTKKNFNELHHYQVADELSRQEEEFARKWEAREDSIKLERYKTTDQTKISKPKRYNKFKNIANIHSWGPLYADLDKIMAFSSDYIYEMVAPGISAVSQNKHGTMTAGFGYSAHKDPLDKSKWKHAGHLHFTYTGWYPVLEFSLDVNDRNAIQYKRELLQEKGQPKTLSLQGKKLKTPGVKAVFSTYIPFNFTSGGWQKGFVPKFTYTLNNDIFDNGININELTTTPEGTQVPEFKEEKKGKRNLSHMLSGSLRAFAMLPVAKSAVYPRAGIGAEVGISGYAGASKIFSPGAYTYLYGYAPGFFRDVDGLKLSILTEYRVSKSSSFFKGCVNTLPRGLESEVATHQYLAMHNDILNRLTMDYTIPIHSGDFNIDGSLVYIKRFVFTPHFDLMMTKNSGNLYSAGFSFVFDLESIIWLGLPFSIGVTYSYNGGSAFAPLEAQGLNPSHHYVGPVFNISL